METGEVKLMLQRYFSGETSDKEEQLLRDYFMSAEVDEDLKAYSEFFGGISELNELDDDDAIEDDVMDFILENEHREKTKFRKLWMNVTGIAASVVIVMGGFLFYQQQQKPFEDSFDDPEQAYAYAQETLQFVSGKYNKGLASLSGFDKLNSASRQIKKGVTPINEFYSRIEQMEDSN